ncbi:hypothetical protein CORC01_02597 [Colletotrichum orchidophilum]|uniref:Uncharacterized protein n=1 Tax=Colletotrichum orchidophilum TaxID=1209926 RepID=A0A1G4BL38_9PEZI|nr:uncharacterized protein CORC01_02597 [Colletotrichum orchidophilum]OHF02018.1 hypothetical protein CORC01_02597 [Colletotrichum orchidophilum]
MAHLLSASKLAALYDSKTRQLVLTAQVPAVVLGADFVRVEAFVGGLKFTLQGFFGGVLPPGTQDFQDVTTKFPISLPAPHFNNKSVLIDTADGTKTVEIKYTGFDGVAPATGVDFTAGLKIESTPIAGSVLTPINVFLPASLETTITAVVPKAEGDSKVSVVPTFNEEFLRLVNATVHNGVISYTFRWAQLPTGQGQNPQLINITTTTYNDLVGPAAKTSSVVQGYIIHFVLLKE